MPKRLAPYKLEPPTFSGEPKDFHTFHTRFTALLDIHKEVYSDGDLCNILSKAMEDREEKKLVERYSPSGFDEAAMKQLKARFGRAAAVNPALVEELVTRSRYDYSQESMFQILDRTKLVLNAMNKIGGKTIEQFSVALVARDFDHELKKEWIRHVGDVETLPGLDTLVKIVEPLSRNLSRKRKSLSATSSVFKPLMKQQQERQQDSSKKSDSPKSSPANHNTTNNSNKLCCAVCKGSNHPLH